MTKSPIAFPFFTLREETVEVSEWRLFVADQQTSFEDIKKEWVPGMVITIERDIAIPKWKKALHDLEIGGDLSLGVSVKIGTGKASSPWVIDSFSEAYCIEDDVLQLRREISSPMLNRWLHISTSINFDNVSESIHNHPMSPKNKGDRLWYDNCRVDLDDSSDAFPISITPFSQLNVGMSNFDAPWYLDWSPSDWHRDYSAAIRIYINEEDKSFTKQFLAGDPFALQMVMADVISQICQSLALADEHIDEEVFEDGSLGQKGFYWIRNIWSDLSLSRLKAKLLENPALFKAECVAFAAFEMGNSDA